MNFSSFSNKNIRLHGAIYHPWNAIYGVFKEILIRILNIICSNALKRKLYRALCYMREKLIFFK